MKERPILFSAPMVRAILEGRKTQTRRVVKPQPFNDPKWGLTWEPKGHAANKPSYCERNVNWTPITKAFKNFYGDRISPYGKPGDRLWVKETWADVSELGLDRDLFPNGIAYRADCKDSESLQIAAEYGTKWRPSIFMPRWASRITLEITGVRVERLQSISEEDATAEGVVDCKGYWQPSGEINCPCSFAYGAYMHLWESINGKGSWDANPWVWVLTFKRV